MKESTFNCVFDKNTKSFIMEDDKRKISFTNFEINKTKQEALCSIKSFKEITSLCYHVEILDKTIGVNGVHIYNDSLTTNSDMLSKLLKLATEISNRNALVIGVPSSDNSTFRTMTSGKRQLRAWRRCFDCAKFCTRKNEFLYTVEDYLTKEEVYFFNLSVENFKSIKNAIESLYKYIIQKDNDFINRTLSFMETNKNVFKDSSGENILELDLIEEKRSFKKNDNVYLKFIEDPNYSMRISYLHGSNILLIKDDFILVGDINRARIEAYEIPLKYLITMSHNPLH